MIHRDLEADWKHAQPWDALTRTRELLQDTPLIWHFLELPEARGGARWFVATGHNVCHDCALCEEQGNAPHNDADPVPWRESYPDCCDDQDPEVAP